MTSSDSQLYVSTRVNGIELSATEETTSVPYTETERLARDRANIQAALLLAASGKVSGENGAASLLGIKPTTLASRMKTLGMKNSQGPD